MLATKMRGFEMTEHEINLEQFYLEALLDGSMAFVVWMNERGYQKGDILVFHNERTCQNDLSHTNGLMRFAVTYVHSGYGVKDGFVVMGVKQIEGNIHE